jgi:hypothetical protein
MNLEPNDRGYHQFYIVLYRTLELEITVDYQLCIQLLPNKLIISSALKLKILVFTFVSNVPTKSFRRNTFFVINEIKSSLNRLKKS